MRVMEVLPIMNAKKQPICYIIAGPIVRRYLSPKYQKFVSVLRSMRQNIVFQ